MNPFFRNILVVNPKMLNKIPERFINEDDVKKALDKGYEVTEETPIHLLKFEQIALAYYEKYRDDILDNKKILSPQEIIHLSKLYLYEPEVLSDEVIKLNNYSEENQKEIISFLLPRIAELKYYNIEQLLKSNQELIYEYLKKNPDSLYRFTNIPLDYERVYESIKGSLESFKYSNLTLPLFEVWFKKDKSILIKPGLSSEIYNSPKILDYIKESGYSIKDLSESSLFYSKTVLEHYLKQDFSNIEYVNSTYERDVIKEYFFKDLERNIKHLKKVSTFTGEAFTEAQKKEIIDYIITNRIGIEPCDLMFIKQDSEVCYLAIMNNPKVLFEWENFNFYCFNDLSQDKKEDIKELIRTKKVVFTEITEALTSNRRLLVEVLKINPFLVDTYKNGYNLNISLSELLEYGYSISINTPGYFLKSSDKNVLEALKKDISIIEHPDFSVYGLNEEDTEILYNILRSHNYFLTPTSPRVLFQNPLLVLESLKKGTIKIEDISNCNLTYNSRQVKELYNYILNNYDRTTINNLGFSYHVLNAVYNDQSIPLDEKIYNVLRVDFSKCKKYKNNRVIANEYQKLIYDLYLENYEVNKEFYDECDLLRYNPYIAIYELFEHDKEMPYIDLTSELEHKFVEEYKKRNIPAKIQYIRMLKDNPFLKELLKNSPEVIEEITPKALGESEYSSKIYDSNLIAEIKACVLNGTYKLSPQTPYILSSEIVDFCVENNIPNVEYLLKTRPGYYYRTETTDNIKRNFIKLAKENKLDFNKLNSDIASCLTLQEFHEIALVNNKILLYASKKSSSGEIFSEYEPIGELLKDFKAEIPKRYYYKNEYTNDELKEFLEQNVILLLSERFTENLTLTAEEWKYHHDKLIAEIKRNPHEHLNKYRTVNYEYIIKDGPNSLDKETVLYLCEYVPGKIINLFGDNNDFYNRCIEVLEEKQNDYIIRKIKAIEDPRIKRNLSDKLLIADDQLRFPELYNEDELFDIWIRSSQKIPGEIPASVFANLKIISHIINKDINLIKEIPDIHKIIQNRPDIHNYIYTIFMANQDKFSIYDSNLFFYNPWLIQIFHNNYKYYQEHFVVNPTTEEYYDYYSTPEARQYNETISLKNDPLSFIHFDYSSIERLIKNKQIIISAESYELVKTTYYFNDFLELNFPLLVDYFKPDDFNGMDKTFVVNLALANNYVLTENSPSVFKENKDIAITSMRLNPLSIQYASETMKFDAQEQQQIAQILLSNGIYFNENSFTFLSTNTEYIIKSIKNNPSSINYIHASNLKMKDMYEIINIIKEYIKNNKYEIDSTMPRWLLIDQEIRKTYLDKYPDKATRYEELEEQYNNGVVQESNPYWILDNAIKNSEDIDTLDFPKGLLYPTVLIDKLVDKLISRGYVISDKTPEFLFNNSKFIYYALTNDYKTPRIYIEDFITFENMYKLQNPSIFKKYIDQGYGKKYEMYYDKLGVETTIEAGTKYGYIINKISLSSISSLEDIKEKINEMIREGADINNLTEYIIRADYELTDEEIKSGLGKRTYYGDYRTKISDKDKLFLHLVKKNPNRIKLYTGTSNIVFEEAFKSGYKLIQEEYETTNTFKYSEYISKLALDLNVENTYLYQGNSESFYIYAITEKGFIPEYQKVENNEYIRKSSNVIKKGMYEDLNFAFLYTGESSNFLDIFEIKDKNNKTLEPTRENVSKLTFIHNSSELMLKTLDVDFSNIEFYTGYDSEVFDRAIELGYLPTKEIIESKENFRKSPAIIRRAAEEDIDYLIYYTGPVTSILDLFELKDKNGNFFDAKPEKLEKLTQIFSNDELMKKAIDQYAENIVFYVGENEEIFQFALDKGYIPEKEDFDKSYRLKNSNAMHIYIINSNDKNLHSLLVYYSGTDDELINKIYIKLLDDKYDKIIKSDNDKSNYISIWKSFNDQETHRRLLSYMNPLNVQAFENMKIDYYLVLKYGIQNDKMSEYIRIINENKLDLFIEVYNKITDNYIEFNNNAFGVDLFLKIARLINNRPELAQDIVTKDLTDIQIANLIKVINSKQSIGILFKTEDLDEYDKKMREDISSILDKENTTSEDLKTAILKYVFDLDLLEFKHILENYINYDTLDKIITKCAKEKNELFVEATMLRAMLSMVEETVNATNDIDSLKRLLAEYVANNELVDKIRTLFYDIKERIRNIYELDAIVSLTDLDNPDLPKRESKTHPGKMIVELKNSEYVIYAHATDLQNYEEYVNYRFNGRVTICVSPISNLGKKLYSSSGIVIGFTKVPRGGYIGSSNRNMGSNSYVRYNDYEVREDRYYHLEIQDSSSLTPVNHPETLLYRDGLIPNCIIIRGEEPTSDELAAQEIISKAIREKYGYGDDFEIPLVHTQAIGTVSELKGKDEIKVVEAEQQLEDEQFIDAEVDLGRYQTKLDKIQEIRDQALQLRRKVEELGIEKSPVYDIIRMKIGGSHDMFKCHLKDREGTFYLKPGYRKDGGEVDPYRSYAMEASYKIQAIANPEHAVYVETVRVPFKDLGKTIAGDVLCSAIEVMPNTTSYQGWRTSSEYQELTEQEMNSFVCEFISDYLLFSYDTKAENFLKDKNGKAYGIDKEQSLKFIISPQFIKRDSKGIIETYNTDMKHSLSFDPNGCGIIYKYIFENISKGKQTITQATYEKALEAITRIESTSDEKYRLIFKNYVDDFSTSSIVLQEIQTYMNNGNTQQEAVELVKEDLYESLLARKNNLRMEFTKYFSGILTEYYQSKKEEVPEWIIQTKEMNI